MPNENPMKFEISNTISILGGLGEAIDSDASPQAEGETVCSNLLISENAPECDLVFEWESQ